MAMKSGGFHAWNPADFMARWNLVDFMAMKSGGFHEIQWISCQGLIHYSAVYICIGSYGKIQDLVVDHESLHFSRSAMKSAGFHEIRWISWNPADFMMKSSRFHPWNQADFMADLEKCKLENVNFYNAYNFFCM